MSLDSTDVDDIVAELVSFSDFVTEIKKEEAQGRSIDALVERPMGAEALMYLRAVERAASDRLNRVRRNDALESVLKSLVISRPSTQLCSRDETWHLAGEDLEEPAVDEPSQDADTRSVQETLLLDDDLST